MDYSSDLTLNLLGLFIRFGKFFAFGSIVYLFVLKNQKSKLLSELNMFYWTLDNKKVKRETNVMGVTTKYTDYEGNELSDNFDYLNKEHYFLNQISDKERMIKIFTVISIVLGVIYGVIIFSITSIIAILGYIFYLFSELANMNFII